VILRGVFWISCFTGLFIVVVIIVLDGFYGASTFLALQENLCGFPERGNICYIMVFTALQHPRMFGMGTSWIVSSTLSLPLLLLHRIQHCAIVMSYFPAADRLSRAIDRSPIAAAIHDGSLNRYREEIRQGGSVIRTRAGTKQGEREGERERVGTITARRSIGEISGVVKRLARVASTLRQRELGRLKHAFTLNAISPSAGWPKWIRLTLLHLLPCPFPSSSSSSSGPSPARVHGTFFPLPPSPVLLASFISRKERSSNRMAGDSNRIYYDGKLNYRTLACNLPPARGAGRRSFLKEECVLLDWSHWNGPCRVLRRVRWRDHSGRPRYVRIK